MLIKCPECNSEVSDKAKSCPNCGYKLKKTDTVAMILMIVVGVVVVSVVSILAFINIGRKKAEEMIIEQAKQDMETIFGNEVEEYTEPQVLGMNEEFSYDGGTVKFLSVDLAEEEYQMETDIDEILISVLVECKNTSDKPINNPADDFCFTADYDHGLATIQFDNYSFPDLQPNETLQRKIYVFLPTSAMELRADFAPPEECVNIATFKLDIE